MSVLDAIGDTPALLFDSACDLGEGPRWHDGERRLYWVDIGTKTMLRWDAASGAVETRRFDAPVACFGFRAAGGMVLGMKDGCALVDGWDDLPRPFGEQILADKPHHRMNDGRVDGAGRFWVGSLNGAKDVEDATLYRLDRDGALTIVESGMTTCNGAAFSGDGRRFAHSDTPSHALRIYDADPASGTLSNRRILHQFEPRAPQGRNLPAVGPGLGRPDGGSFDAEGCYWVAMFDGWRVVRLSPDGELLREVRLPVQRPTMIAFGGDDGCTAFITSARTGLDAAALAAQPGAGGVFAFRVDVPGVAEAEFAV